jgi:hypothetical protein
LAHFVVAVKPSESGRLPVTIRAKLRGKPDLTGTPETDYSYKPFVVIEIWA